MHHGHSVVQGKQCVVHYISGVSQRHFLENRVFLFLWKQKKKTDTEQIEPDQRTRVNNSLFILNSGLYFFNEQKVLNFTLMVVFTVVIVLCVYVMLQSCPRLQIRFSLVEQ